MNVLELLRQPIFDLPKNYDNNLPDYLEACFAKFLSNVDSLSEGSLVSKIASNKNKLDSLCFHLVKCLQSYYSGIPAQAYADFETAIICIEEFLFPEKRGFVIGKPDVYYRARNGTDMPFGRHEMFHIPFDKREFANTQRFSIPGIPCLYLSNSVYVCWRELEADINTMQVSRYGSDRALNLLDLSLTPSYLVTMIENGIAEELTTKIGDKVKVTPRTLDSYDYLTLYYVMCWPLLAACFINVRTPKANFKPEYIIPQYLLQWVMRHKDVDGIKYFSVKANLQNNTTFSHHYNYAIPARKISPTGYCKNISNLFSLTDPISWSILTINRPDIVLHDQERLKTCITALGVDHIGGIVELIKGKRTPYLRTIFGKIEMELCEMELAKLP